MNTITKKIKLTVVAVLAMANLGFALPALAAPVDSACEGLVQVDPSVTCDNAGSKEGAYGVVADVINILSIVVGVAAVVVIIIGGIRYIVSGGDSAGVQGAKNTILYAVVGLVVALFAQVIVRFVLTQSNPATS